MRKFTTIAFTAAALRLLIACASPPPPVLIEADYEQIYVDGVRAEFDADWLLSDAFFTSAESMTAEATQQFLAETPYGNRSWLADYNLDDLPASEVIAATAAQHGLNPLLLLARMQGEQSLIRPSERPSQNRIDYAFGCGCADGQECNPEYRGLDKQLTCAAKTLRRWYDASVDGTGRYRVGDSEATLDEVVVMPQTHATASLYAYTPWVSEGEGGNWLLWKIHKSYRNHALGQWSDESDADE